MLKYYKNKVKSYKTLIYYTCMKYIISGWGFLIIKYIHDGGLNSEAILCVPK